MSENEISYEIRGAIYEVYKALGPGLLESAYEAALAHELRKRSLNVKTQTALPMIYDGLKVDVGCRIDLIVNNKVIIEIKSVENLTEVHHKQVITYLKLSNFKLGLLVNFNTTNIFAGIFRKVNNF